MAPPVIAAEASAIVGATGASSLAVSTPTGTVGGSLLVAWVSIAAELDITAPSGWTQFHMEKVTGQVTQGVWWRFAASTPASSHTFTWAGTNKAAGAILRITGADSTTPVLTSAAQSSFSSVTDHPAPSVNATTTDCLLVCGFTGRAGGGNSYTPPSGMTELLDIGSAGASSAYLAIAHLDITSTGNTGTKTAVFSTTSRYATSSVLIQDPSAAVVGGNWGWRG